MTNTRNNMIESFVKDRWELYRQDLIRLGKTVVDHCGNQLNPTDKEIINCLRCLLMDDPSFEEGKGECK